MEERPAAFDELMALVNRLLASALALAAVAARLRLDELELDGDPAVRAQLDRVADVLGVSEQLDTLDPSERAVLLAFARSYLAQGLDLVDDPAREGAWTHSDTVLLQAQGSASAVVATLLGDLGLLSPGARILDVGTGVAGLATALCEVVPNATVVGVDPWPSALELARANTAAAGLESRITLVETTIEDLEDDDGFDLAWLPSFFIPETALDDALARIHQLMRRRGHVVVGVPFSDESEPLAQATDDLLTVRSGGSVLSVHDAIARMENAGFRAVHELERTWNPPIRFVIGERVRRSPTDGPNTDNAHIRTPARGSEKRPSRPPRARLSPVARMARFGVRSGSLAFAR
jgi:ubiquinone/menaquinone biosynthesis C-methylase UbiE